MTQLMNRREQLRRAYLKGHAASIAGRPLSGCPYQSNTFVGWWHRGYRDASDGTEAKPPEPLREDARRLRERARKGRET